MRIYADTYIHTHNIYTHIHTYTHTQTHTLIVHIYVLKNDLILKFDDLIRGEMYQQGLWTM